MLLLSQLLKLDINEQLAREVDYLMAESQVLKNQITTNGKRLKFTQKNAEFWPFLASYAMVIEKNVKNLVPVWYPY